jgi:hypothetical protein
VTQAPKSHDTQALDALTQGAFSAPTSGERAARVREWMLKEPSPEQMQEVFRELSVKDKGAAKLLREKLDELKRAKGQEALGTEWAQKAQALLQASRLNVADAMAWQRDAAKAGAPLSREPLLSLKSQVADRVKGIEDLQHRVQVQREAAVLLAQRTEILSTKSWRDAQTVMEALQTDVQHWQTQAAGLLNDANWPSVDAKYPPLLESSRAQLLVVWDAFKDALTLAVNAAADAAAALPPVPVWADELRAARGIPVEAIAKPAKPRIDPQLRAQGVAVVQEALDKLEQEVAQGHGKASTGAATALRNALKEFGKLIDDKLEGRAHSALSAAGELEGWQRWRADQLREELVAKAEGLLKRPEGQAMGGRKMQESLRALREQWKQTDQGGVANHALWKRFDEACNEGYKVVETWLEKIKTEATQHKAQRLALIEEVNAWATANPTALDDDWKGFNRILHQFGDRWRDGGHVGERLFEELKVQWKAAINQAAAPLEAVQKQSLARRQAMIEEAAVLGAAPVLRIDAVKSLQQRWQAEAHAIPLDRRHEQNLWDAFRKPIDEAFNRKTSQREQAASELSERDRVVLNAAKALEAANASGDAQKIRKAMEALEAALRGQAQARVAVQASVEHPLESPPAQVTCPTDDVPAADSSEPAASETETDAKASPPAPAPAPIATPRKPVVAVRGDDRPGQKKTESAAPARSGKFAERKDSARAPRGDSRDAGRGPRRPDDQPMPPRLGDSAFRAQRDALEHAQLALRKLAAQAHGESLSQLMAAWEKRESSLLPSAQELGNQLAPASRQAWIQALSGQPSGANAAEALLRLEMAAELPTPASELDARRALQLKLLTRRNDPAPAQTWAQDAAKVLASAYEPEPARRLQNVLKVLFRK